jgi:anti-anti-sigma factor
MSLDVQERPVGSDITVVTMTGRLHAGAPLAAAEQLVRDLVQRGRCKLAFDCSALDAIDSAGVGMLLMSAAAVRNAKGQLRLVALPPRVAEVLRVARVLALFEIDDDLDLAIRKLADRDEVWFEESEPSDR